MSNSGTTIDSNITAALISAAVAFIVCLLTPLWNYLTRPSLQIKLDLWGLQDFEVTDAESGADLGYGRYVKLRIDNKGRRSALLCEAKIEPMDEHDNSLFDAS